MCRYNWMPKNDIWGRRHPPFHEKKTIIFVCHCNAFSQPQAHFSKKPFLFLPPKEIKWEFIKVQIFLKLWNSINQFLYAYTDTHMFLWKEQSWNPDKSFFFMELMGNHFSSKCMVIKMASGLRGWWRRGYFAYNLLALSNIVQTASRQTTCFLKLFLSYLCILPMPTKHFFQTVVIFY